mmetsp:Transcript_4564/g.6578  ORF Transcript_4564/g.6578 Transcript_4564/m.6578 type:complete len:787 (-) Transcript_4564:90-2450(-)
MIVQSVEPDTTVSSGEKDGASIPIQIPLGARYIEVNDLQGTCEASFHKARIITNFVITLCMIFGSYIVIENRLYDVSFKFDRDGGVLLKRNLERFKADSTNHLNSHSRGGNIEDSFSSSTTSRKIPHPTPSIGSSKRSKSDEDERLVRLLEQRILMLEKKLSYFEADKVNPETKTTFALFPALVSTGIPDNIKKSNLDRHKTYESASANGSPSIRFKRRKREDSEVSEVFTSIRDIFSGLYRFIFSGGSVRIRQSEQGKAWIEYDKDMNTLVVRFLSKDQYVAHLAKPKQDANSKKRMGKKSADMKKKLKSELAAVKSGLINEVTELKKTKETEEVQLKKNRARKEAEFRKKMEKEAAKSRKKITEKQSQLKKTIEEEEKADLKKRQKEEETQIERKINQEVDKFRRKVEKQERYLREKIKKEEADLLRRNEKLNGASDIIVKEMKTVASQKRLAIGDTELKEENLSKNTNLMKQTDRRASIVRREESQKTWLNKKLGSRNENIETDAHETTKWMLNTKDAVGKGRHQSLGEPGVKWQIFSPILVKTQRDRGANLESEDPKFPCDSKRGGLYSLIRFRRGYKRTSPERTKSCTRGFFTEISLRRKGSDSEGKFASSSKDGSGDRFFSNIKLKRRSKSAFVHGPFYEQQSSAGNSEVSAIKFRRRKSRKRAMEESYLSSHKTERKQVDSQTNSSPGFWNYFFNGVFDGFGRIRLRSIRQITKDTLTKKKRARRRSETKHRLKKLSSRTTNEPPNYFSMRLKQKKKQKKVPQYPAIRIRQVASRTFDV